MAQMEAEKCTGEELQMKRLDRARVLAGWKKEELYQTYTHDTGEVLTMTTEAAEDMLRGLAVMKIDEGDKELVARLTTTLRKVHKRAQDHFCRTSVVNKYGFPAVEKIFKEAAGCEGMTAEQQKAIQAYVKEQQEGGGKWKKGSGNNKGTAAAQPPVQSEMGPLTWPGQFGPQAYWGWQMTTMQPAQFNYSSGYGQQVSGGGNQGRGDRKARFPVTIAAN
jgi:hypothetical protein